LVFLKLKEKGMKPLPVEKVIKRSLDERSPIVLKPNNNRFWGRTYASKLANQLSIYKGHRFLLCYGRRKVGFGDFI
jgi:hypothetical protein